MGGDYVAKEVRNAVRSIPRRRMHFNLADVFKIVISRG
jgi:hypothetical protein